MSELTDEVLALERGFWEASDDPRYFEETIADDGLTVIEPMGFIDKAQAVVAAGKGERWTDVEMEDVQVRQLTPDCVIVAYHGRGRRPSGQEAYTGTIASTYVMRDGRWRLGLTCHQPWDPGAAGQA